MSAHPCAQILANTSTNSWTTLAVNRLTVPPHILLIEIIVKIISVVGFMSNKGTTVC
jgi:hypothetical protein